MKDKEQIRKILREDINKTKSIEIQAPNMLKLKHSFISIFLAGSIESFF